jgi:thioredoxin-related protein
MVSTKSKLILQSSKTTFAFIIIILSLMISASTGSESRVTSLESPLLWSTSYPESLEQAKSKNMPVLIKFEASWCVWCQKMEEEVFTDPEVIKELGKFVCVKIDVDKQTNVAKAYKIKSLPRTIVINTYDEIVGDWLGYQEAPVFYNLLRDVDEYTHTQTGTTSVPKIQEAADTSIEGLNIPVIDPNKTDELIGLLGYKNAGINQRVVELLIKTGPKILPRVVPALESRYLGTRIAAWKVVHELTGNKYRYDPWSSTSERVQAAKKIKEELRNKDK